MYLKKLVAAAVASLTLLAAMTTVHAGPQFAIALQGYDAVSYFDGGAPAKGVFDHAVHWNGATWLFASASHASRFRQSPTTYAPQFDGYCALAAALGYKAPAEALTGKVVDGKLYLNYNAEAARVWTENAAGNIAKGEQNWPKLNAF